MKKKFLALFVTLALILAPAAFAASAVVPCYREANAAVVSPLEGEDPATPDGEGGGQNTDPENGGGQTPDEGEEGGGESETPANPDEGGEPNPDENGEGDPTPEVPEVPAAPLDASFQTNIVGFVVLGLVAVCALFALVLCICGKRKIANVTKKKKA